MASVPSNDGPLNFSLTFNFRGLQFSAEQVAAAMPKAEEIRLEWKKWGTEIRLTEEQIARAYLESRSHVSDLMLVLSRDEAEEMCAEILVDFLDSRVEGGGDVD